MIAYPRTCRGFTLIEALLATALLAVLAAASAGLLRDAARLTAPDHASRITTAEDVALLGLVADLVLEEPERSGLTTAPSRTWDGARLDPTTIELSHDGHGHVFPFRNVSLRLVLDAQMPSDRERKDIDAWLIFTALDAPGHPKVEVARRVHLPEEAAP